MNSNPTILFAEDEKMFMANELDFLEDDIQADIQFCEEVGQTKRCLKNSRYDLIILDQYLPDSTIENMNDHCFSGIGDLLFHQKKKNKNHGAPVLLITTRNVRNLYTAFKKKGVAKGTHYTKMISKPFREGEFEKAVFEALHPGSDKQFFYKGGRDDETTI